MIVFRGPAAVASIEQPEIRRLATLRFESLSEDEPYDPEVMGCFIVLEPDDAAAS